MSLLLDVQNLAVGESANFVSFVSTVQTDSPAFFDGITVHGVKIEKTSEDLATVTIAVAGNNYRRGSFGYDQLIAFDEMSDQDIRDNPSTTTYEFIGDVDVLELTMSEIDSRMEDGTLRELSTDFHYDFQPNQMLFVSLSDFSDFLIDAEQELFNTEWINSVCNWMRGEG